MRILDITYDITTYDIVSPVAQIVENW